MTDTDYSTEIAAVVAALNAVFENKEANKKDTLSGDYSSDTASYPTCKSVKAAYGTRDTSWSATASDSNIPSEKLVKDALDGHSHATGDITNSATLANIGSNLTNQGAINSALNDVIGALKGTKFIEIENKPSTASESTMGKLYVVTESGKVNVYYTKQTGTGSSATYSWQKLDANILDDISDATQSTHGWMSAEDKQKVDINYTNDVYADDYEIYENLTCTLELHTSSDQINNFSFFHLGISSSVRSAIAQYDDLVVSIMIGETRKNLVKLINTGSSGIDSVYVKDIRTHGTGLLVYNGYPHAFLVNPPQSSSDAVNEVKVFAGQLADAIDAINPSSS